MPAGSKAAFSRVVSAASLAPSTVRHVVDLARNASDVSYPVLFELYDLFLEPLLVAFESDPGGQALLDERAALRQKLTGRLRSELQALDERGESRDASRALLCFLAGMLAANPAAVLLGGTSQLLGGLTLRAAGRDGP